MEVISLGLLALASSAFLAKAKVNSKKSKNSKKEGFIDDKIFGTVAKNGYPQEHKDFVKKSVLYFNPLSALLNTNSTNFSFSDPQNPNNQDANWVYRPELHTSNYPNIFRTYYSKETPNGLTIPKAPDVATNRFIPFTGSKGYTLDQEKSDKMASVYDVPSSNAARALINTCENTNVVSSTDPTMANCAVFNNSDFGRSCGICHRGQCSNAEGNSVSATPMGLFVSPRMKQDPTEQDLQREALLTNKNLSAVLVGPTLGKCGIDSSINRNLFSLDSNSCEANNKYVQCKNNQNFPSNGSNVGCFLCHKGSNFYFIDNPTEKFSIRQPTTFTLGGSGTVTIRLDNADGTQGTQYLGGTPDANGFISLQPSAVNITLQPPTATTPRWKIPLLNGEAAAGKYLHITLTIPQGVPFIQGKFYGDVRSRTTPEITDFTMTAYQITPSGRQDAFYKGGDYGMKIQPIPVNGMQLNSAVFKILIPLLYIDTNSIEATYCDSGFVVNSNSSNLLSNAKCFTGNQSPGNYTTDCLKGLFLNSGCTDKGAGYPVDQSKTADIMIRAKTFLNLGRDATQGEISAYLYAQYQRSWSGLDSSDRQLSSEDWLASQTFCTDAAKAFINPCANLPDIVKENGRLSDECVKYIYTSGYSTDSNNGSYNTYFSNANAASVFGKTLGSSKKDRYCTENGTISPLSNAANMELAKSKGGITNLKNYYNNIHAMANKIELTNAQRAQYVMQCYGTTLNVQADSDPTLVADRQVSATTCGTNGSGIGNIRYVRVWSNESSPYSAIQISQLVVLDSRGQNVALNKPFTYSTLHSDSIAKSPVDGTLQLRDYPNIYHSVAGPNEFFEVDLIGSYDIVNIIYFNRNNTQERAIGTTIALYGNTPSRTRSSALHTSQALTEAPVQYIDLTHYVNDKPKLSCPQMLSGQRGNLLDDQTTSKRIQNDIVGLTPVLSYPIFNRPSGESVQISHTTTSGSSTPDPTTAKKIWNHPYAVTKNFSTNVAFYVNIYNSNNLRNTYYLWYKCDNVTNATILLNNVTLPSTTSGTNLNQVILVVLPGQNLLRVSLTATSGQPASFAAAIWNGGVWISKTDSSLTNFYTPENAKSSDYSWQSYTSPNIGILFQCSPTTYTIYNITYIPVVWNQSEPHGAKWIWNQPDAGKWAAAETVHFYINITVGGTTVIDYTLNYCCDNNLENVVINEYTIPSTYRIGGLDSMHTLTFKVVPGTNCLKVPVWNGGNGPNLAGFKAYITDSAGNFIAGTATSDVSNWKCTTQTSWSSTPVRENNIDKHPCIYVPDNQPGVPYYCASNIFKSYCTGGFDTDIYDGTPAAFATVGTVTLPNMSRSQLATQFFDHWGSNSRSNYDEGASNRQQSCLGKSVCPKDYKYHYIEDHTGVKANFNRKCIYGTDSNLTSAMCPAGYTYDPNATNIDEVCYKDVDRKTEIIAGDQILASCGECRTDNCDHRLKMTPDSTGKCQRDDSSVYCLNRASCLGEGRRPCGATTMELWCRTSDFKELWERRANHTCLDINGHPSRKSNFPDTSITTVKCIRTDRFSNVGNTANDYTSKDGNTYYKPCTATDLNESETEPRASGGTFRKKFYLTPGVDSKCRIKVGANYVDRLF